MQTLSLFARARLPASDPLALPEALTVAQLAELRASPMGALDRELFLRLLGRMADQVKNEVLVAETRTTDRWDGEYEAARTVYDGWGGSKTEPSITTYQGQSPPKGAVKHFRKGPDESVITKNAAQALFKVDPENWGDGSLSWMGGAEGLSLQAQLDAADVQMTAEQAQALMGETCTKSQLIDALEKVGYIRTKVETLLGSHASLYSWIAIARADRGKYYPELGVRLFDLANLEGYKPKTRPQPKLTAAK